MHRWFKRAINSHAEVINEKVKSQGKFSKYSYISATGFVAFIKPRSRNIAVL